MSIGVSMGFVMNLLHLLFSASLVHSDQSMVPLKSFKISENVTYDCIDIYKQPGLDHPLLRNHTIQMKPSVSRPEVKNHTGINKTYKKKINCPYGTVPVLRDAKEFITSAQLFTEKHFHPLTTDRPGTHIAGVRSQSGPFRGVKALFSEYNLNIVGKDQASYSEIYIGSGINEKVNFISAGFMINPGSFGDIRVWSYGFWKGKGGKGCYNTTCPGFVQVWRLVPLAEPVDLAPGKPAWLHCSIRQDSKTGNWWITQNSAPDVDIGYWSKELFDLLDEGGNMAGVGGVVQTSHSGLNPPMGNGQFPSESPDESALFANVEVLSSEFKKFKIDSYPIEKLIDSTKCYGLKIGKNIPYYSEQFGFFFNYGGPGGNSCGI